MAVKKAMTKISVNGASTDREKTLELALAQIEKSFGRGAVMRLGESNLDSFIVASVLVAPAELAIVSESC